MKQIISVNVKDEISIELKELHDKWIIVKKIKPVLYRQKGNN